MNALKRCSKLVIILLLCLNVLAPTIALAGPGEPCVVEENKSTNDTIKDTFSCRPATGITYRFTECVDQILHNVADTSFDKMLNSMGKVVGAVLTLFVATMGIKMVLGGVRNMRAEALVTFLKMSVVAYFALAASGAVSGESGLKQAYDLVQGINTGLVHLVSGVIVSNGPCSVGADGGAETNLWKRVDCSILSFIGKNSANYQTKDVDLNGDGDTTDEGEQGATVLAPTRGPKDLNCDGDMKDPGEQNAVIDDMTLFDIGLSQLFTPQGVFVLILLGAAALMMLIAFGQALQIYVMSMVAITFLMMLAPIFIPCMLFERTKQIFQTWMSMILAYMIQPAMLMAFLVFLLASFNIALFGDPVSGSPGLKQSLEKMNAVMVANQCTRKVEGRAGSAIMGGQPSVAPSTFVATLRNLGKEINSITVPTAPVPYKDLAVFMVHLIACCVLLYVMVALLANVADFVGSLSVGAGGNLGHFGHGLSKIGGMARDVFSR